MFLGSVKNHNVVTHRMLNLLTKIIALNHDVIWLNKTYGDYLPQK